MIKEEQLTQIGNFNSPHGINGEISATITCEDLMLTDLQCIVVNIDGLFVPFFISAIRNKNYTSVLLTIDGITNEKEVSILANKPIYALREQCSQLDNDSDGFYAEDLIGYGVADTSEKLTGEIIAVDDSTENVLFIIRTNDRKEVMIPVVDEFIDEINESDRIIVFDLPAEFPGI